MTGWLRFTLTACVGWLIGMATATFIWAGTDFIEAHEYAKGFMRLGPGFATLIGGASLALALLRKARK